MVLIVLLVCMLLMVLLVVLGMVLALVVLVMGHTARDHCYSSTRVHSIYISLTSTTDLFRPAKLCDCMHNISICVPEWGV